MFLSHLKLELLKEEVAEVPLQLFLNANATYIYPTTVTKRPYQRES